MKNLKIQYVLSFFTIASIFVSFLSSCSNDESDSTSFDPPVINTVSRAEAGSLTPTAIGYANNMYIIQGSGFTSLEKIYFNDTDTYFNPTLATDTSIFVTIDLNTPYADASNEIKLVTKAGSVTYPFVVAPPAPIFNGFSPVNVSEGEATIIKGRFFLDPVVTVGNTPATVVSNSLTEIEIILPADSKYKDITVTTISGSATSTYAVGTAIFDNEFDQYYDGIGFSPDKIVGDPTAPQGNKVIKLDVGAWSGVETTANWWPSVAIPVADYTGFGMWIKADHNTDGLAFMLADWNDSHLYSVTTEWQFIVIPFSNYGEDLSLMKRIQWVNRSGDPVTYYIDYLGFVPVSN